MNEWWENIKGMVRKCWMNKDDFLVNKLINK